MVASKATDIFAFAMLVVEVFTGKLPFGNMKNGTVLIQIAARKRPIKPQAAEQLGLTVEIWKFVEKCWTSNPSKQPTVDEVVGTWEGFVIGSVEPPSGSFTGRAPSLAAKGILRVHHGAVGQTMITSGNPPEVMRHVLGVLLEMGLEVQEESQYKFRCVRPGREIRDTGKDNQGGNNLTVSSMFGSSASGGVSVDSHSPPFCVWVLICACAHSMLISAGRPCLPSPGGRSNP